VNLLHITNGDHAAAQLASGGLLGEVLAWSDILFAGPERDPGLPNEGDLAARAAFIADTFGLLQASDVLTKLQAQYAKLSGVSAYDGVVLWFDACLMDQTTLVHLFACFDDMNYQQLELVEVGQFPGIADFHGLGQLLPADFVSLYPLRRAVPLSDFAVARRADRAFAKRHEGEIRRLAGEQSPALPFLAAACACWLEELPDAVGLGKLDRLIVEAMDDGARDFPTVHRQVAARDLRPRFWGDSWLEAKYRRLLARR
jgi:hypothetical protein